MRTLMILSFAAALGVTTTASAQVKSIAGAPDEKAAAVAQTAEMALAERDPDRRVCKSVVATGSRLGKNKVCKSARDWANQQLEDRRALEKLQGSRTKPMG